MAQVKEENMEKMKHAYAANRENNFDFSVESGVGATQVWQQTEIRLHLMLYLGGLHIRESF